MRLIFRSGGLAALGLLLLVVGPLSVTAANLPVG